MAFQQGAGGSEFGEGILFGHHLSWGEGDIKDRDEGVAHQARQGS
jgi:hypothetical protein